MDSALESPSITESENLSLKSIFSLLFSLFILIPCKLDCARSFFSSDSNTSFFSNDFITSIPLVTCSSSLLSCLLRASILSLNFITPIIAPIDIIEIAHAFFFIIKPPLLPTYFFIINNIITF